MLNIELYNYIFEQCIDVYTERFLRGNLLDGKVTKSGYRHLPKQLTEIFEIFYGVQFYALLLIHVIFIAGWR